MALHSIRVMSTTETDVLSLADRLITAITAGDIETVRSLYAPDAVVWHNHDNATQTVEENLRTLAWISQNLTDLRYEEIQRQATDTGFVEQHVLRAITPNGGQLEVRACLIGTVQDGRVTRIDEYLDSAALAALVSGVSR
jgi:ketosteroid isomerase-like protein